MFAVSSELSRFDLSRAALTSEILLLEQLFIVTVFGAINFDCEILILVKRGRWPDMLIITNPAVVLFGGVYVIVRSGNFNVHLVN